MFRLLFPRTISRGRIKLPVLEVALGPLSTRVPKTQSTTVRGGEIICRRSLYSISISRWTEESQHFPRFFREITRKGFGSTPRIQGDARDGAREREHQRRCTQTNLPVYTGLRPISPFGSSLVVLRTYRRQGEASFFQGHPHEWKTIATSLRARYYAHDPTEFFLTIIRVPSNVNLRQHVPSQRGYRTYVVSPPATSKQSFADAKVSSTKNYSVV